MLLLSATQIGLISAGILSTVLTVVLALKLPTRAYHWSLPAAAAMQGLWGFGLAIAAPVHLPVGDDSSFNTDGAVRVEPRLIVDWRHSSGFALAANFGYQLRPEQSAQNIVSDDVLRWGVATQIPVGLERVRLIASIFGNVQLEGDREPSELGFTNIGENQSSPMEALGGLQIQLPANFVAQLGAGAGLSSGVGSPALRAFASIGYTPMITDRDGDGIPDSQDQCPDAPEDMDGFKDDDGCPDLDNDQDGILDAQDQCPDDAEDKDGFEDDNGCPDPDNDGDGILDVDDKCPTEAGVAEYQGCPVPDKDGDTIPDDKDLCPEQAEDFDKFQDDDGCPDPDNDGDGILDVNDQCPNEPENYNSNQDDDGCPDEDYKRIKVDDEQIRLNEQVFFRTNKSTIMPVSYPLLDEVAVLLGHAAPHRDLHALVAILARLQVTERAVELVVGVLADAAGVEHDDVGGVLRRGRDEAVGLEEAGDALGVVLVHLAPEGPDEVALAGSGRVAASVVPPPRRG